MNPDPEDARSTHVSAATEARRLLLTTAHRTHAIANFMETWSNHATTHRGFRNFAVMSNCVKRACMYYFAQEHGIFPILHVNLRIGMHCWSGSPMWINEGIPSIAWLRTCSLWSKTTNNLPHGPRCVIVINNRHVVSCRECPMTGNMLILDTCHDELPRGTERLLAYLNRTQTLSPRGQHRVVKYDPATKQQYTDSGGCCVMSLCNHILPNGSYASAEVSARHSTKVHNSAASSYTTIAI